MRAPSQPLDGATDLSFFSGSTGVGIRTVAVTTSEVSEGSYSTKYTGCAWDLPTFNLFTAQVARRVEKDT